MPMVSNLTSIGMYDTIQVLEGIMAGWHHEGVFKEKPCVVCGEEFKPRTGIAKFCSEQCKGKWQYISGRLTTESQYKTISGSWSRYFDRLLARNYRGDITRNDLLKLLARQGGRCALTGELMTCQLIKGQRTWTNASMDRIQPGGPYSKSNVQLVCVAVNLFRVNIPVDEFILWCRKVADYAQQKQKPSE